MLEYLQKENSKNMDNLSLILGYGTKEERNSPTHSNIERMALDGNLKAAHVLAWNHAVGFQDGKADYAEAYKLAKLAMPAKLPDTYFLMAMMGPALSLKPEMQYALIKMGLSFNDETYVGYKKMSQDTLSELEQQLTTSQKIAAKNLIQRCEDKEYSGCIE